MVPNDHQQVYQPSLRHRRNHNRQLLVFNIFQYISAHPLHRTQLENAIYSACGRFSHDCGPQCYGFCARTSSETQTKSRQSRCQGLWPARSRPMSVEPRVAPVACRCVWCAWRLAHCTCIILYILKGNEIMEVKHMTKRGEVTPYKQSLSKTYC